MPDPEPLTATPEAAIGRAIGALLERWGLNHDDVATAAQRLGLSWGRSTISHLCAGRKGVTVQELLLLPSILAAALGPDADRAGASIELPALLAPDGVGALELAPSQAHEAAVTLPTDTVRYVLEGQRWRLPPTRTAVSEADRKTARALGLSTANLAELTHALWGRSLTDERNHRLGDPEVAERFWRREALNRQRAAQRALGAAEKAGNEDDAIKAVRSLFDAEAQLRSGPPTEKSGAAANTLPQLQSSISGLPRFRSALRGRVTRELLEELRTYIKNADELTGQTSKRSRAPRKARRNGAR
jgi:hypothetical protein